MKTRRKLRMGMIGGGKDAFIGSIHRFAALLDGQIELVCGAFSSQAHKSVETGEALFLPSDRIYASFSEMIKAEKALPEGERMDFVSIVTPNHLHYEPVKQALENGFPVICDKPLAFSMAQATELQRLVEQTGLPFALTHTYTGYPMVKEAQQWIRSGKLGTLRKVVVEYPQGWLSSRLEAGSHKQADWRTDPARAGISCCMGDIGSHAENLAEYITGLKIKQVCADLTAFVDGRLLDDDGSVLLRFEKGVKGVLMASQISAGDENEFKIRVYGEKGSLEWLQTDPNTLWIKYLNEPIQKLKAGNAYLSEKARLHCLITAGHPEGFLEAFANIYRNFGMALRAHLFGEHWDRELYDFPTVTDGVRGMAFIEAVVASSRSEQKWLDIEAF
jgi:predicted dehydrogenase